MLKTLISALCLVATAAVSGMAQAPQPAAPAPGAPAAAQPPSPPPFSTTKVEGTDNVYIFRFGGHQSMFVVTSDGVIATDPIGLFRPHAVRAYIDEIRKVTQAPIRYVIYSHHHYDHSAGGQPFKDMGATFVAHKNAKNRLESLKYPDVVVPDQAVEDSGAKITLGNTELELHYVGNNHSDNSLVMRLPRERLIFAVDFIPIQALAFRGMPDHVSPIELERSIERVLAMEWDRMIPGHPGGGRQIGTKKDAEDHLAYLRDLSAEVKKAADANKCFDPAMREIKLPKYESWANYAQWLPGNVERYCYWWGRGY